MNYFADYSYFNSAAEMDRATKQHLRKHWNTMIATDRAATGIRTWAATDLTIYDTPNDQDRI